MNLARDCGEFLQTILARSLPRHINITKPASSTTISGDLEIPVSQFTGFAEAIFTEDFTEKFLEVYQIKVTGFEFPSAEI